MATSSFVDFQVLKQSISITDLIPWLGLKGNWHGDQWRGTCPQCNGSDRSLVVTKSKAAFYCFTAKKGGCSGDNLRMSVCKFGQLCT